MIEHHDIAMTSTIRAALSASLLLLTLGAGCRNGSAKENSGAPPVVVGPENIAIVRQEQVSNGPVISGSLQAADEAIVRAQISGPVVAASADVGQHVAKGQLLMRIDDSAIREQVLSARSAVATAEGNLTLANHNLQRSQTLLKAGAIADRDLETAQNAASAAQAQLENARAMLANAEKQLAYTQVTSPFSGAVSARPANPGDVVSPGTALITVVDPASMRLEASVPSDQLSAVRIGLPVEFSVRGYPTRTFTGHVTRISPSADPATRQVPVVITIPNVGNALVAGLFAEGRVESDRLLATVVPTSAVDERGLRPVVARLKAGVVQQVPVTLGVRDPQTERVAVKGGLVPGDTVLTGSALALSAGTPVRVNAPPSDVNATTVRP